MKLTRENSNEEKDTSGDTCAIWREKVIDTEIMLTFLVFFEEIQRVKEE